MTSSNDKLLDALAFASITSRIDQSDNKMYEQVNTGFGGKSVSKNEMDDVLKYTTLKRACCLMRDGDEATVPVKIPIPIDWDKEDYKDLNKFGRGSNFAHIARNNKYIFKDVRIPKTACIELLNNKANNTSEKYVFKKGSGNTKCDAFYSTYCNSLLKEFKEIYGPQYTPSYFALYAPDCACYGEKPKNLTFGKNLPESCYLPGCTSDKNDKTVYNAHVEECKSTICNANINFSDVDIAAGGGSNIDSKISNECGDNVKKNNDDDNEDDFLEDDNDDGDDDGGISGAVNSLLGNSSNNDNGGNGGDGGDKDNSNMTYYIGIGSSVFSSLAILIIIIFLFL